MAHFAELNENNIVTRVIVVNNQELIDESGNESEAKGIKFCQSLFGGRWIQASYNESFRKRFPCADYKYDATADAFVPPQTYPSWVLNTETYRWEAPVAEPDLGGPVKWNEELGNWEAM
jgi:hypothetical protein